MLPGKLVPHSLSARVFWLIAGVILLVELLIVIPGLGRERQDWLWERVTQGRVAAFAVRDGASVAQPQLRDTLLRLADISGVMLSGGARPVSVLPDRTPPAGLDIDLDHESLLTSMWRADQALFGRPPPYMRVHAHCPRRPAMTITVIVSERKLAEHLRAYLANTALLALLLAIVTGGLTYAALHRQLVRPMRIMTAGIAEIRRNPGYGGLAGLKWLSTSGGGEIARAASELVAMQDDMRAALWRNARLAALGTAVAKISHDLRNILTSALLVADRFHHHADPAVRQASNTLIPAMERAVELVSRTVDFAQEGPPAVIRSPVPLAALVDEVAEMLRTTNGRTAIDNQVPHGLVLPLDRNQIYRVLVNLLRNAAEAGATRIALRLDEDAMMFTLVIADNGPGLPKKVVANLFRPFSGSGRNGGTGLGLAIARDLARAHGGDLALRRTGPGGTEFALTFSDAMRAAETAG